jgi:hypothetical protein
MESAKAWTNTFLAAKKLHLKNLGLFKVYPIILYYLQYYMVR